MVLLIKNNLIFIWFSFYIGFYIFKFFVRRYILSSSFSWELFFLWVFLVVVFWFIFLMFCFSFLCYFAVFCAFFEGFFFSSGLFLSGWYPCRVWNREDFVVLESRLERACSAVFFSGCIKDLKFILF